MKFEIERPPLSQTFYLPTKEDLLKLNCGDLVKIMFRVDNEGVKRMLVKIVVQQDIAEWTGELDNDPIGEIMSQVLKCGFIL